MADKNEVIQWVSPEGRLINGSLFEKDTYKDAKSGREGEPAYKAEMAFDDGDEIAELEDMIVQAIVDEWGDAAEKDYDDGKIESPLHDGDELAKRKEDKNKPGDAYKGKVVIRASTKFNAEGVDGPGGVYVADTNAEALAFTDRARVYNGCMGKVVVTISPWSIDKRRGVTLYLKGFQLTGPGERLRSGSSVAGAFKPVEGGASKEGGRRRRKG